MSCVLSFYLPKGYRVIVKIKISGETLNQKIDHTEGKRMRRTVKATSGHTGVLQKFDDPLQ